MMLYISFFPQLVAGPIVKAHQFYPQIAAKRFSDIDWAGATDLPSAIADYVEDITAKAQAKGLVKDVRARTRFRIPTPHQAQDLWQICHTPRRFLRV